MPSYASSFHPSVRAADTMGRNPRERIESTRLRFIFDMKREDENRREKDIDLVIWPENSSDINPFRDGKAATTVATEAQVLSALAEMHLHV